MTKNKEKYHSGTRLQRLRKIQGITWDELGEDIRETKETLKKWEEEGIPEEKLIIVRKYFDVSVSVFTEKVNSILELNTLVQHKMFQSNEPELEVQIEVSELERRIQNNQNSQSPILDLSGLGLTRLPEKVLKQTWLTHLDLGQNELSVLPISILKLKRLTSLDLSDNQFEHLPSFLLTLPQLQELIYQDNEELLQRLNQDNEKFLQRLNQNNEDLPKDLKKQHLGKQGFLNWISQQGNAIMWHSVNKEFLDNPLQIAELYNSLESENLLVPLFLAEKFQNIKRVIILLDQEAWKKEENPLPFSEEQLRKFQIYLVSPPNNVDSPISSPSWLLDLQNLPEVTLTLCSSLKEARDRLQKIVLKQLKLKNIGIFGSLSLDFQSSCSVLIGPNGSGKSTIMKALALAILGPQQLGFKERTGEEFLRILGKKGKKTLWSEKGVIQLFAEVNGQSFSNSITIQLNQKTESVELFGTRFEELFQEEFLKNLMLGIGEQRSLFSGKTKSFDLEIYSPKPLDLLPLVNGEDSHCIDRFIAWVGNLEAEALKGNESKQKLILIAFEIFSKLMNEKIYFAGSTKVDPLELWVEHEEAPAGIPLRLASQGYQTIMGWVGLILERMFEVYQNVENPLSQPAVILVDEIDQLLHPKWQQEILNVLSTFLPNTQWIITTHSPLVVQGLDRNQIIQLSKKKGSIEVNQDSPDLWVWQYEDVVQYLFETSPPPLEDTEKSLKERIDAIKNEFKSEEQEEELERLDEHLERIQRSRSFVDQVYKAKLSLEKREKELAALIQQLQPQP